MKHFLYKLDPPRPTFHVDMTAAEGKLMLDHVTYWNGLMNKGQVIAFGPVADPKGPYGIAVMQLEDSVDANRLVAHDPTIKADVGFTFAIYPMPDLALRALLCRQMFERLHAKGEADCSQYR
jgi:uncharacterized protein YciI